MSFEYWSALWTLIGLAFFVFALYWLNRSLKFQAILQSVIESLAVLSLFYISLDVLGFFLIILRNVVVTL
jgi:thiol:disulfide interchange protein